MSDTIKDRKGAVVLLSGGLDSTTLLWFMRSEGDPVEAIAVDYGQRHRRELDSARRVAELARTPLHILDASFLSALLPGSSQTDPNVPVPHGRYDDVSMRKTVVPNRNMILLAIAIARAAAIGARVVAYAAHSGDHPIYPDCRPEFVRAMGLASTLGGNQVQVWAPFESWTKNDILHWGSLRGVPYELTWTCYEGGDRPCGKCGACVERAEAFASCNRTDPVLRS